MLRYVTTNEGKVREAEEYLRDEVEAFEYDYTEIQADSLEAVAAHGAREAFEHVGEPVIVDDAGLFLDGFDGFPGPYSAYVEDTLGVERVGRLARREDEPRAAFRCVIAYCDGEPFDASPEPVDLD
ncbi:MAG: non-canonical purine NTP pyrophosphatase, partial [Natronomonas sp.]|nr:non-canonical purine NTP pyrophosphatase [Natronomonas sp.]